MDWVTKRPLVFEILALSEAADAAFLATFLVSLYCHQYNAIQTLDHWRVLWEVQTLVVTDSKVGT